MQHGIQSQHTSQGERIMKTLYLIYRSCSKHFVREIFLIFQITVVILLLNTAITPFVNAYQVEHIISGGMPENAVYYSRPTFYSEHAKDTDPFGMFMTDDRVGSICLTYYTQGKVNGQETDILLYNEGMFKHFSSLLKNGEWVYDTSGIILNEALREYVGDHKATVTVADDAVTFSGEYNILGSVNAGDIVYNIVAGGSEPEISQLGVNFEYVRNTSATPHTPFLAIIPFDFESAPELLSSVGGAVLIMRNGTNAEKYISDLPDGTYNGHLYLRSELSANSQKRLIGTYKVDALLSILLTVSSVFGISGYTYLKTNALQKQMGIYKLCGCRNTTYAKIILMTDLILVAASALLAFSLRNVIILGEGNDSTASFLISVGFIAFICISPIILTVLSARRLSFSELLYFGD